MIDLNELAINAYDTARKREENGANIKTDTRSMLKHCATEVVEAMEAYHYWQNEIPKEIDDMDLSIDDMVSKHRADFEGELADIIACVLIICGKEHIDIEQALEQCVKKNKDRAERIGDKL